MQVIDILRDKANRAYMLCQKTKKESRKKRLRALYRHYYNTYRRQRFLIEEINQLTLKNNTKKETAYAEF